MNFNNRRLLLCPTRGSEIPEQANCMLNRCMQSCPLNTFRLIPKYRIMKKGIILNMNAYRCNAGLEI